MSPKPSDTILRGDLSVFRRHAAELSGGTSSESLYRRVLRDVARLDLQGRVLDFGAGAGNFTQLLVATGRFQQVVGADLLERPAALSDGVDWIAADLNQPLPLAAGAFDAVVSIETIEHLENPRAVMREWYRLLRPGGTLMFTTPNNDNLRSVLTVVVKGHFQQFTDPSYPAHISALLTKDVERITREAGFADLEVGYEVPARLYGPVTFRHLLPFQSTVGKRTGMHLVAICRKR